MFREAVIVAGGFGTRLKHIVNDVPKPMAPVCGKPFLRYILDYLAENKFSKIVIADGYKRECIEQYFGSCYRGMEVIYSSEDSPLLTGGAVKKALKRCDSEWVYVLNGDTFLEADYDAFEASCERSQGAAEVFIAAKEMNDFERYGTLQILESGEIVDFLEKKPTDDGIINAGVYLIKRTALDKMPAVFSLEKDYFELIASRHRAFSVLCNGTFIDIGVPEDYKQAQPLLAPFNKRWKLALFDRDGTINVDTGHLFEPEKLQLIPRGIELLRQYASNPDYKIVVVTNQAGIAKGLYGISDMHRLHAKLDQVLEQRECRVDAYYYCPHHPEITGDCECRKPKPGMIKKALFDFEADPAECVMYGDKDSDIEAANAAGIRGILINKSGC